MRAAPDNYGSWVRGLFDAINAARARVEPGFVKMTPTQVGQAVARRYRLSRTSDEYCAFPASRPYSDSPEGTCCSVPAGFSPPLSAVHAGRDPGPVPALTSRADGSTSSNEIENRDAFSGHTSSAKKMGFLRLKCPR